MVEQPVGGSDEFSAADTHRIGLWPEHRMIAQSAGRGWRNVYASVAQVNRWSGALTPVKNYCVAFCLNKPVTLTRTLSSDSKPKRLTVRPRQFFIIPAHEETNWDRSGTSDMLMVYLRQELIEAIAAASGRPAGAELQPRFGEVDPMLEQLALSVVGALERTSGETDPLYIDSVAHMMASHLLVRHSLVPQVAQGGGTLGDAGQLHRLRDFIEASLDTPLGLERLAGEAGIGIHTFPKAFARHFGQTPHQYVLTRRVERAKALLAGSNLPIAEIALQAGFSNQSHLTAAFRQRVGLSPAAWRKL